MFEVLLAFCLLQGNIVTCGVVGAYAVVLAVNAYVYTSLSYITLNILKRFLNNNFSPAFTDAPFQTIGEFSSTCFSVSRDQIFNRLAVLSFRLRLDHGVGGAGRVRRGAAAAPRALAALLPAQPVPHVAAGARAPQDQRAGPEPPRALAGRAPGGEGAAARRAEGAGRRAHATAAVTAVDAMLPPAGSFAESRRRRTGNDSVTFNTDDTRLKICRKTKSPSTTTFSLSSFLKQRRFLPAQ